MTSLKRLAATSIALLVSPIDLNWSEYGDMTWRSDRAIMCALQQSFPRMCVTDGHSDGVSRHTAEQVGVSGIKSLTRRDIRNGQLQCGSLAN